MKRPDSINKYLSPNSLKRGVKTAKVLRVDIYEGYYTISVVISPESNFVMTKLSTCADLNFMWEGAVSREGKGSYSTFFAASSLPTCYTLSFHNLSTNFSFSLISFPSPLSPVEMETLWFLHA